MTEMLHSPSSVSLSFALRVASRAGVKVSGGGFTFRVRSDAGFEVIDAPPHLSNVKGRVLSANDAKSGAWHAVAAKLLGEHESNHWLLRAEPTTRD
jgi:hypothetical protein